MMAEVMARLIDLLHAFADEMSCTLPVTRIAFPRLSRVFTFRAFLKPQPRGEEFLSIIWKIGALPTSFTTRA